MQTQAQEVALSDEVEQAQQITSSLKALEQIQQDFNDILHGQTESIEHIDDVLDDSQGRLRAGLEEVVKIEKAKKKNMTVKSAVGGGVGGAAVGVGIGVALTAAGPVGAVIAVAAGIGALTGAVLGGKVGSSLKKRANKAIDAEVGKFQETDRKLDKAASERANKSDAGELTLGAYDGFHKQTKQRGLFDSDEEEEGEEKPGEEPGARVRAMTTPQATPQPRASPHRGDGPQTPQRGGDVLVTAQPVDSQSRPRTGSQTSSSSTSQPGGVGPSSIQPGSKYHHSARAELFKDYVPAAGEEEAKQGVWSGALMQAERTQRAVGEGSTVITQQGAVIRPMTVKMDRQKNILNTAERVQNAGTVWGSIKNWWRGTDAVASLQEPPASATPASAPPMRNPPIRYARSASMSSAPGANRGGTAAMRNDGAYVVRQSGVQYQAQDKRHSQQAEAEPDPAADDDLDQLGRIVDGLKQEVTLHNAHLREHNDILDTVNDGMGEVEKKLAKQAQKLRRKA